MTVCEKLMVNLFAPEDEMLFTLLCATGWHDEKPRVPKFMVRLLADKNMTRALNIVESATKKWKGIVSEKGIAKFLASGYIAKDIDDRPGGFTIFMFRPRSYRKARSEKETQSSIRSVFGDGKLSDEMVKYFAKDDFFIPKNLYELEDMVRTCIQALDLFTNPRSIASDGYRYGLKLLTSKSTQMLKLFDLDRLFPTKFAYVLDKAFQNFASHLSEWANYRNPIAEARREGEARNMMKTGIDKALGAYDHGAAPNLVLPAALAGEQQKYADDEDPTPVDDRKPPGNPQSGDPPWWTTNPSPVKEWCLPVGKSYKDFFNPSDAKQKANTAGWPSFPHHSEPKRRALCVRYQSTGKCRPLCRLAHVKPSSIEKPKHDDITSRLTEIYKT